MAEKFPIVPDTDELPLPRHWANLPGGVIICFTKKLFDGKFHYHLSISEEGVLRADNMIVLAILRMLGSPQKVNETSALYNQSVRHFMWDEAKKLM